MAKLFDIAQQQNARVILSVDRYQHSSVERNSALRLLEQEAGLELAELTDTVRQRDRYRQYVADLVVRNERIAAKYVQAMEAGKSVLVVSPTRAEKQAVPTAIRDAPSAGREA